jgi:replicative DNA helicase
MSTARRIVHAAQSICVDGLSGITDINRFVADSRKGISEACGMFGTERGVAQTMDNDLRRVWSDVVEKKQPAGLIPTGISTLDRVSGGLWPGVLTVLAGRPGMGKSAFVLNIATNAALSGKRVLYITLEDTRYFVAVRLLARFAKLDNITLTMRAVRDDQQRALLDGYNRACGLPLWVDDVRGLSSAEIRSRVMAHKDKHGIDLLVLDHLAEIREDAESETAIVSQAARGCADLVSELDIPGLLAHQLNRKVEDRADKRPTLADLKQSGKVEEVARAVWLLYRPGYYEENGEDRRDLWAIVAKANHGKTGVAKCWANLAEMYIRGWEQSDGEFPGMTRPNEEGSLRKWHKADGTPVNNQRSPYKDEY